MRPEMYIDIWCLLSMYYKNDALKNSRRVQKLAEEVASLLVDEQGLITDVENGKVYLIS